VASQNLEPEHDRSLETLAILAAACIIGGLVFKAWAFAYAALGLLLIGLLFRRLAVKLSVLWLSFAAVLGAVNSKILLTVIYYLVLVPVALIYRRIHGSPMNLGRGNDSQRSYWTVRDHRFEPRDLERPW
jgi:hypothetical protein